MRLLFAAAILAATTIQASAACNGELLTVSNWSIRPIDNETNELTFTVKSNAAKPIRMIDGQLGFKDAIGGRIGPLNLKRDVEIAPGGTHSETGKWGPYTFERLLKLKKEEVSPYTCVRAVLYDDGTKEEFK